MLKNFLFYCVLWLHCLSYINNIYTQKFILDHCIKYWRTQVFMIMSLYGRIRVSENRYSRIFYAMVSIFGTASWFFQQQFLLTFQHWPALHFFQIFTLRAKFFVVAFAGVSWSLSRFTFQHFKFLYLLSDYE